MTHRLGFRGYMIAWGAAVFYVLMVITSPTEMIPFTKDIVVGIFGAADAAGEGIGSAREDYERQQLKAELQAELRDEGWHAPPDPGPQLGSELADQEDAHGADVEASIMAGFEADGLSLADRAVIEIIGLHRLVEATLEPTETQS